MGFWPTDCFKDAEVLVIGGTSGIGAGIALAFQAEGARVSVTGATSADVDGFAANHPGIPAAPLDVRDAAAVAAAFTALPSLDHLVYCAGVILRGAEHDPAVFDDVVDINLHGAMRAAAAARPLLSRRGGTITNMASMLSFQGGGLVPGYAASKGGLAQLTKSLAIAYAADGIRVNAIAPGWISTGLTQALQDDPARNDAIMARTPLRRWGTTRDVAGGVIYLASPMAAFLTGTILVIDGGYLIN